MNTKIKIFLTSVFAVFVVYSGVAESTLITSSSQETCDTGLGSDGGTIKFFAKYQPNSYTCNPGTYLDKTTATCVTCGTNYFCPGGTFVFNGENQGLNECDPSKYKFSSAGSWALTQCYSETGTEDCSKLNKIDNGTATYANNSTTFGAYSEGTETQTIGACAVTALTCDNGYTKTPATNGALVNYTHQTHNLSSTTTKYRALNGDNGANLNSTGLTNGQWQIGWTDGTVISGVASCNTTTVSNHEMSSLNGQVIDGTLTEEEKLAIIWADGGIGSRSANTFNSQSTGTNCWCKMDSYTLTGGSAQTISSPTWKFIDVIADDCASYCVSYCNKTVISHMSAFLGTLGQQMACVVNSVTCNEGEYLNGILGQCVTCLADHYCAGGTFTPNGSDQGLNNCPVATPNSNPGAKLQSDCYVGYTCPAGQYLEMGKTTCAPCPAGSYCPDAGVYPFSAIADQGRTACPLDANGNPTFSATGSTSESACSDTITCPAGQYLVAGGFSCSGCPSGSYCSGQTCSYSIDKNCGIKSCADLKMDDEGTPLYPNSDANSAHESQCYGNSGTRNCAKINKVTNGTATYANTSANYRDYYNIGTEVSPLGACAIQSLTCNTGYTSSGTNGVLSAYVNQSSSISTTNTKWYAINGSTENSSASTTGLTPGQFVVAYNNGTQIFGRAFCSATSNKITYTDPITSTQKEKTVGTMSSGSIDLTTTGAYCWCNVTGYQLNNASAVSVNDSDWVYDAIRASTYADCAEVCAETCVRDLFFNKTTVVVSSDTEKTTEYTKGTTSTTVQGMELLLGELGQQMECSAETYTCNPGYYLAAGDTTCSGCKVGFYCPGGSFTYSENDDQGAEDCTKAEGADRTYTSAAGARSSEYCYKINADVSCATINPVEGQSVGYANTKTNVLHYLGGGDALETPGACAITTLTCPTGYSIEPASNGPLSASIFQSVPFTANPNIKYRAINGDNGINSGDNNQGSHTGMLNGEYEVDLGSAKIHGYASYLYKDGKYACACSMDSYTLSGGSAVTVNPAKGTTSSYDALPLQSAAESKCAQMCAMDIARNDIRIGLFADLGQQKACSISQYTCAPGYYLPKEATACVQCTINHFCPGGIFSYSTTEEQGIHSCPSGFAKSVAGSWAETQCYKETGTDNCSTLNAVSNSTSVTYANTTSSYSAYSQASETENIGACAITALTCDTANGYVATPATNGVLANYAKQAHNISKANCKYRALNGDDGKNSSASNGYGDSTGMTNGTGIIQWTDGTKINVRASCNSTDGVNVGETRPNNTFNSSSTGKYCWCNMTGYQLNGGSATNVNDSDWTFANKADSNSGCANDCASKCVNFSENPNIVNKMMSALLGTYGQQMACEIPTYSCNPGYYLPKNETTCVICPAGYYCKGVNNVQVSSLDDQGKEKCSMSYPNSAQGTTDGTFCYKEETVNCKDLLKIDDADATYANATATRRTYADSVANSVIPVGACAIIGATCQNSGETLIGSAGPLSNYESPVFGMPFDNNKEVHYRAINGDNGHNSGDATEGTGDYIGMQNGTFRLVYGTDLEVNGTASCDVNADGKYDCHCSLTSYKIGSGSTVSVNPAVAILTATKNITLSSCQYECAHDCAKQTAQSPEFGDLGDTRQCGIPQYNCAPGEYLAMGNTTCSTCPGNGYYCPGGTWDLSTTKDQGKDTCPDGYLYSDTGAKDIRFCYKNPSTQQCSVVNPVRGASSVTYANQTAATRIYYHEELETTAIGACAVSSISGCNTGYAATNTTDGPLVNYINQSRNLNLSSTKYLELDGSTGSGASELYAGSSNGMTAGTFELVYNNGTKIMGRASCNTTAGDDVGETRSNNSFNSTSTGKQCWINMTEYQLNGQSTVNVNDSNWVYITGFDDASTCSKECLKTSLSSFLLDKPVENVLFGSYGKNPVAPCNPNTYNITWYDGNTQMTTNQCSYDDDFTLPTAETRTGYNFMGYQVIQ